MRMQQSAESAGRPKGGLRNTMKFITKKHLPRRTFLRGVGVTLALPLLDSMVPAQTPLAQTAAAAEEPVLRHLRAARRDDGQVDAGDRKAQASSSPRS